MKTINLTVFSFDELSENVQKKIIEREHWNVMEQCMDAYGIDYKKSMKAFEDMTDTRVYNWEVGYERYDFSYEFKYKDPIYEHPTDYHRDIFPENLCGKLLFRYINNNIMPYIIKGKYFSTSGKYIDEKYKYRHKYSRVMFDYGDNCPLTGMCYDYYLLKPIIDYYNVWCTYPEGFSLEDLIEKCYNSFFKTWHEEYEYWADDEDAIREELHYNQYEDRLYYEDGDVLSNKDGSYIFILNMHGKYLTSFYASLAAGTSLNISDNLAAHKNHIECYRLATDSEKQKMIKALKKSENPKAKEYLKRFFGIKEEPKYEFKPFDKVLVRKEGNKKWNISLFAREIVDDYNRLPYKYECSNGTLWDYCINFEGNEHLLGTAEAL